MTRREYKLGAKALGFLHDKSSTVCGLVGPFGSGKSTLIPLRIQTDAAQTVPDSDGVRRYRALLLRGTYSMIESALLPVMRQHMPPGTLFTKGSPLTATYKSGGVEIHCDLMALDKEDDVRRVQGGSYDALYVDEARDCPWGIVQTAMTRVRAVTDSGAAKPLTIGIISNPSGEDHWLYKNFVANPLTGWKLYHQPSGLSDGREGPYDESYYRKIAEANRDDPAYVAIHVHGQWGVHVPEGDAAVPAYRSGRHLAELVVSPNAPLLVGLDVGVSWNALVFAQRVHDQIRVIGELVIDNAPAVMAAPQAVAYVRDYLWNAPVGLCCIDPSAEQRSAVTGELVIDVWRGMTNWPIQAAASPRVSERINALNAAFQSSNGNGDPSIVVDQKLAPQTVRALAGEYRWKMKRTPLGVVSSDGELDKNNRPFADVGDALGYLVIGAGVHAHLVNVARNRSALAPQTVGGFDDSDWEI